MSRVSPLLLLLGLAGCPRGLQPPDMGDVDADPHNPTHCAPGRVVSVPYEGAPHVAFGTPVTYRHYPPASGPHWSPAHSWGVYDDRSIPPEWWVHNLEHGGIVFLF